MAHMSVTFSFTEYDGVVLAAEPDEAMAVFTQEAFRHHKTVALTDAEFAGPTGIDLEADGVASEPAEFFDALALHRHWER